jgi:hypothetical protein
MLVQFHSHALECAAYDAFSFAARIAVYAGARTGGAAREDARDQGAANDNHGSGPDQARIA